MEFLESMCLVVLSVDAQSYRTKLLQFHLVQYFQFSLLVLKFLILNSLTS